MPRGYRMGLLLLSDSPSVPDGSTVTPINDVPTWLKCAGIPTTTYTTLSEVLADASLLRVLINSENAMDYLVRCKEWIGLDNGLVPIMTSNTTPSGTVSASSYATSTTRYPYKAFDGDITTVESQWMSSSSSAPSGWLNYEFETAVCVRRLSIKPAAASTGSRVKQFNIQGSNDGFVTYETLFSGQLDNEYNHTTYHTFNIINNTLYKSYRINVLNGWEIGNNVSVGITEMQYYEYESLVLSESAMQFIGANDYAYSTLFADADWKEAIENSEYFEDVLTIKAPIMTSANTPSGIVTQSSIYSNDDGFAGWRAFDGIVVGGSGAIWHSAQSSTAWIQYEFPSNVDFVVRLIKIQDRDSSNIQGTYNVNFKRSLSGEIIKSFSYSPTNSGIHKIVIDNTNSGNICRLEYTNPVSANNSYTIIAELNFYGRPTKGGVQSWLLSANITNKNYTTLNQVLADTDTLTALISSHSAMDYLVTCTSWANDICSNQTAMTLIGNDNYASDKLLADATWINAIVNSTYIESVLNVKIPTMTSNTVPSGECIANSSRSQNQPYSCFDSSSSTYWLSSENNTTTDDWLGYDFGKSVKVHYVDLYGHGMTIASSSSSVSCSIKMQAYNGSDWVDITEGTTITSPNGSTQATVPYSSTHLITGNNSYNKYRLLYSSKTTGCRSALYSMQCYGRVDV